MRAYIFLSIEHRDFSRHFASGAAIKADSRFKTLTHYCHVAATLRNASHDETSNRWNSTRRNRDDSHSHDHRRERRNTHAYAHAHAYMHIPCSVLTLLGSTAAFAMLERKSWLTRELCEVPLSLDTLELSYSTSETSSFILPFTPQIRSKSENRSTS